MAKTKKDLVKYLADYIEHEICEQSLVTRELITDNLLDILEQGLDAFESTEGVRIEIWPVKAEIE